MIFDYLNDRFKTDVQYEILECNGEDRTGGRLYTYNFPPLKELDGSKAKDHQYYDVGAMRFPEIPTMKR